jgi:thioredoxin-like negative regulator of GroEL
MMTTTTHEYRLKVHAAGKNYSLDLRQAFYFGYALARTRRFKEASAIFEALVQSDEGGPSVTIILAYCKVSLRDYTASRELLDTVFPEDAKDKADQLHTAFVYMSVGMWADAVQELAAMVQGCPDLPVVCLLVGDLLVRLRKRTKALMCWRLAVARDRGKGAVGAVAATAKRLLSAQMKQPTRT